MHIFNGKFYIVRRETGISPPRVWMVKPDILISIHGLDHGSFLHFQKPDNIFDG